MVAAVFAACLPGSSGGGGRVKNFERRMRAKGRSGLVSLHPFLSFLARLLLTFPGLICERDTLHARAEYPEYKRN